MLVASVVFDKRNTLASAPAISTYGAAIEDEADLIEDLEEALLDLPAKKRGDDEAVSLLVKRAARIYFDRTWGKRPLIQTSIHRLKS